MSYIKLKNIRKSFDDRIIISDMSLEVREGEMVSLLGPSGCGKTTTLKIIAGLLDMDDGDILFDGRSVRPVSAEKRNAVIVFQDHRLFPHMTARKNIEFGLKMRGYEKKYRRDKSREMLKLVHLEDESQKYPDQLSGGQQQRVALARALAVEPKVLLLDEPFSNLDSRLREEMRSFISQIQKKLGITTIMVTHDKSDALMTSDKLAVMIDGRIIQAGSPREMYESPNTVEVANFFGDINSFSGENKGGIFKTKFGKFKLIEDKRNIKSIGFKPENISLVDREYDFKARVTDKRYAGDRTYYKLVSNGTEIRYMDLRKNELCLGEEYSFKVDSKYIIGFKEEISGDFK